VIRVIQSEGDFNQHQPISQFGDKGVFVRALERALLNGEIDLAVHSLKDVPSDAETPGLSLVAFSKREDPRDCLVSKDSLTLECLPQASRVGTSSLRRRIQLLEVRPDVFVVPIRGNVDTRVKKVTEGEYDAAILAAAGLHRLGLTSSITEYLSVSRFVPDAGQGIVGIQARSGDSIAELAKAVDHPHSHTQAVAERAAVRAMGADCRSPVGIFATLQNGRVHIRGVAANEDGSVVRRAEVSGLATQAEQLGNQLGAHLRELLGW
jgi:hydroxymethylbilane synthase